VGINVYLVLELPDTDDNLYITDHRVIQSWMVIDFFNIERPDSEDNKPYLRLTEVL
jgi:hypothetical protein